MKRVLVTGASGFIGRQVLPQLAASGWEVHAVQMESTVSGIEKVTWHSGNLLDREVVRNLVSGIQPSHLLHLAWYAKPGEYWSSPENFRWVISSLEMANIFSELGGKRIVVAGTCAEYDWAYGYCREGVTPLVPATLYGRCKNGLQQLLKDFGETSELEVVWGRIFNIYGPNEAKSRLVPSVTNSLLRGEIANCTHGKQVRDYLHVYDVASAFKALLENDFVGAVNIGSGNPVTVRELVSAIAKRLNSMDLVRFGALPVSPNEASFVVADNSRLQQLGWKPVYDLEQGIDDTISWWQSQDELAP